MALPEDLGLELEQASQLLGQLARSAETHHQNCAKLHAQWGEIQSALSAPLPADERKHALEQGGGQLEHQSQATRQAYGQLHSLDSSALQSGITEGGSQIEHLAGQARRATDRAGLDTTRSALAQSAGAVDGHRQELRGAHEQSRGQARDCWQSGAEGRSQWQASHDQTQSGVAATRQALEQKGGELVEGALGGALGWFDEHHASGLKVVAGHVDAAAGALDQYLSSAAKSAEAHSDSSRDALHRVRAQAGEHQMNVQQALTKTLSALESSQGQTRQSLQTAQNATAEAKRVSGLLGQVHDLSQLLDPKAWELP